MSEIDHYELLIDVRSEHYGDRVTIQAKSQAGLDPEFVVRGDVLFERYVDEDDPSSWVEVRSGHVVARRQIVVHRDRSSKTAVDAPVGALARLANDQYQRQPEER
jgi:hypothetical protein